MAVSKLTKDQQVFVDSIIAGVSQEAKKGLVATSSKPYLVDSLRAAWRKSAEHTAEQIIRFVRLMLFASVVPLTDLIVKGDDWDWRTLLVVLVPVFEGVYRQVYPALGAKKADQAPGVTIVPTQVDPQAVDVPVDDPLPNEDPAPDAEGI